MHQCAATQFLGKSCCVPAWPLGKRRLTVVVPHGLSFLSRRARRTAANLRRYPQSFAGNGPATRRDPDAGIYPGLYPGTYLLITQQRIKRVVGVKKWELYCF